MAAAAAQSCKQLNSVHNLIQTVVPASLDRVSDTLSKSLAHMRPFWLRLGELGSLGLPFTRDALAEIEALTLKNLGSIFGPSFWKVSSMSHGNSHCRSWQVGVGLQPPSVAGGSDLHESCLQSVARQLGHDVMRGS